MYESNEKKGDGGEALKPKMGKTLVLPILFMSITFDLDLKEETLAKQNYYLICVLSHQVLL